MQRKAEQDRRLYKSAYDDDDEIARRAMELYAAQAAKQRTAVPDQPYASLEVTAESVRFLGGKNGAGGMSSAAQSEPEMDIDEEEIPF